MQVLKIVLITFCGLISNQIISSDRTRASRVPDRIIVPGNPPTTGGSATTVPGAPRVDPAARMWGGFHTKNTAPCSQPVAAPVIYTDSVAVDMPITRAITPEPRKHIPEPIARGALSDSESDNESTAPSAPSIPPTISDSKRDETAKPARIFDVREGRSNYNPGLGKRLGTTRCDFPAVLSAAEKGDDAFKALDPRQIERALGEAIAFKNHKDFPSTGVARIINMLNSTGTEINRKYYGDAFDVLESDIKARLQAEHARMAESLAIVRVLKIAKLDCEYGAKVQGGIGGQSPIEEYGNEADADHFLIACDKIRATAKPEETLRSQTASQSGSAFVRVAGGKLNLIPGPTEPSK